MKLLVEPESDSYNIDFGQEFIRVELDGGRGRSRRDIIGASNTVNMTFVLDPTEYNYFMAFYRTQTQFGSEPFEMDLIIGSSTQVTCTCSFKETPKLSAQEGLAYTVSAVIEVQTPYDEDLEDDDTEIIDDYNESQGYTP